MNEFKSLVKKEFFSFCISPVNYFFIAAMFCISAFIFFNLFGSYNAQIVEYLNLPVRDPNYAPNLNLSVISPYFNAINFVLLLFVPFLTMMSFAGEKTSGMMNVLLLSKLSALKITLAKFISIMTFTFFIIVILSILPLSLILFSEVEKGPVFSAMLGVVLSGLSFASIGILCSSLSKTEFFSAIFCLFVLFVLYIIHAPAEGLEASVKIFFTSMSPLWNLKDFLKGIISLKSIVYFTSLVFLSFGFTYLAFYKNNYDS